MLRFFRRPRLLGVAAAIVAFLLVGFWPVRGTRTTNADPVLSAAIPTVAVAKVGREDLYQEVTFPAEFRPYEEVELHAKVAGYVRQINVDFGDQVKAGQLLATLEVPELQDELRNAIATEQKTSADYTNAHLIYTRLQAVNQKHPNLVAQQDLDTAEANEHTAAAASAAARANREKFQTLVEYTKITAPFDGVITHRYADPGALIQAGTASDTQSLPLVRLSDNYRLRLDFPVDVEYVKDIQLGDPVKVNVESQDGRTFTGTISRFTRNVNDATRKMTTEIEVPNPTLALVPGMYASVVLSVEKRSQVLTIPVQAVDGGQKNFVRVLNPKSEIEERAVTLGLETPEKYEVVSGLREGELVVVGNRSQFQPGQKVVPRATQLLSRE
ncbi:MAG TPA: efflux RND transporter periplasmic adaptor subunit [Candidatus Acidoferrum sp.]|nr:efflux RND transporter periplasmic adaptor subunit [Candidatus Acidoferrum sp.]